MARPGAPPSTKIGEALTYLDNQWPNLVRVLDDGRLEVDNNFCENAIRPFVLGRKAWLFSDTPAGAEASARLYSLIETAKANNGEPYDYLKRVFTELPKATTLTEIETLLPWTSRHRRRAASPPDPTSVKPEMTGQLRRAYDSTSTERPLIPFRKSTGSRHK